MTHDLNTTVTDPRCGTYAGANAHWAAGQPLCPLCTPVSTAKRRENHSRRRAGDPGHVPATGTLRRLQALRALGWTVLEIAAASGVPDKTLRNPQSRGTSVHRDTAAAVRRAYDQLRDTEPTGWVNTRTRAQAARQGWAEPVRWAGLDIDEPTIGPKPDVATMPEKFCGCHPHMPNEWTTEGYVCMGCGWDMRYFDPTPACVAPPRPLHLVDPITGEEAA